MQSALMLGFHSAKEVDLMSYFDAVQCPIKVFPFLLLAIILIVQILSYEKKLNCLLFNFVDSRFAIIDFIAFSQH